MFVRNQHKLTLTPQPLGQRSETVRRSNLSTIVRELHIHGALTRSELVARTGLTRTAIRALIGELVAAGLVSEERARHTGFRAALPGRAHEFVGCRCAGSGDRRGFARRGPGRPRRGDARRGPRGSSARPLLRRRDGFRPGRTGTRRTGSCHRPQRPDRGRGRCGWHRASHGWFPCPWPRTSAGTTCRSASASPRPCAPTCRLPWPTRRTSAPLRNCAAVRPWMPATCSSSPARSASAAA